jgi:hypothetical protein
MCIVWQGTHRIHRILQLDPKIKWCSFGISTLANSFGQVKTYQMITSILKFRYGIQTFAGCQDQIPTLSQLAQLTATSVSMTLEALENL